MAGRSGGGGQRAVFRAAGFMSLFSWMASIATDREQS